MIRIIFCILCHCVFLYFLLLLLSVYFSFFQWSWFSVSSSVFFRCTIFFFFAFYTRDFVTYIFETPFLFFYTNQLSSIRNGTYVMYGTYIEPTLLRFCLVACYSVTLSKTVFRWPKNRSQVWFNLGAVHTNPAKKMGFQKCPDSCGHGL